MNDPKAGCEAFDDSRPLRKFEITLLIRNNTQDLLSGTRFRVAILDQSDRSVYTCYVPYKGALGLPDIPAKEERPVTFSAYIEYGSAVKSVAVVVANQGSSNVLLIK